MTTLSASIAAPAEPRDLTAAQLHQLGAALQEQRRFRLAQIAELEGADDLQPIGAIADSDAAAHRQVSATLLRGARQVLDEIDAALLRVAVGGYGRCTTCAEPISPERLEILPMAALCMPCQRRNELYQRTARR